MFVDTELLTIIVPVIAWPVPPLVTTLLVLSYVYFQSASITYDKGQKGTNSIPLCRLEALPACKWPASEVACLSVCHSHF